MAIYHLSAKIISRKDGRSATAAAAYRAGALVSDERTGQVHDYTRKRGVLHAEIVMPAGCPWTPDRNALWNAVEAKNKRADAQVARDFTAALPAELSDAERLALTREFARAVADRYRVAVDFAIHAPDRGGDERNFHAHLLLTTNRIEADGRLGNKARELDGIAHSMNKDLREAGNEIDRLRAEWAELTNAALERAGHEARVDHRSYETQGVDLTPTTHVGVHATNMDRRGLQAERITEHEDVRQANAERIRERPEIVLDRLTARRAGFTRTEMAKELNRYIDDPQEFQNVLARLERSPELVQIAAEQRDAQGRVTREARYSTRDRERRAQQAERRAGARADLKARYRAYREDFYVDRRRGKAADQVDAKARFKAITEHARAARTAVRAEQRPAAERKARLSLIAAEAVQAREQLRAELAEQRRQNRPQDYEGWVRDRAQDGDGAAISQVRGWAYRDRRLAREMERQAAEARRRGALASPELRKQDPAQPREVSTEFSLTVEAVDRRTGDVTYRTASDSLLVDRGREINPDAQADAIEAGLKLAAQKWGPRLDVAGTDEFKRMAVEVAVTRGMNIQFKDSAMQKQADALRQQLVAGRDQARAAAARPSQPVPPATGGRDPARQGEPERPQSPANAGGTSPSPITAEQQFPALRQQLAAEAEARRQLAAAGQPPQVQEKVIAGMRSKIDAQQLASLYRETRDASPEIRRLAASLHPELVKAFAHDAYARAFARERVPEAGRDRYIADRKAEIEKRLAQGVALQEIQLRGRDREQERGDSHDGPER